MADKNGINIKTPVSTKRKGKYCAAFSCNNRFYDKDGHPTGCHFFCFPKEPKRRDRWCNLIKRRHGKDDFLVTNSTYICSDHFREEDIRKTLTGRWHLVKGAAPSQFPWTPKSVKRKSPAKRISSETRSNMKTTTVLQPAEDVPNQTVQSNISSDTHYDQDTNYDGHSDDSCNSTASKNTYVQSTVTVEENFISNLQKEIESLRKKAEESEKKIQELENKNQALLECQFSLNKIREDDSAVQFYTGFQSYKVLVSFYEYLEPKLHKMQYWKGNKHLKESQTYQLDTDKNKPGPLRKLSYIDEFLLVLMRLRLGLFVQDLADRFGISSSLVSRICITWINLMYYELKNIFPFPSQELVRKNMPQEFSQFSYTRIILDCTEVFIQRPSAMLAQSETWSEYKHHNTWKLLVGITPNGQISFLSDLWGGRVSDRQITMESGVLNLLDPGDNVMVDRGFDITNLLPEGVRMNMPPFLGGREQMSAAETEQTMSIASVRIHVERAIGRFKNYHILDGTLPNTLSPYANQIVTVCALLTNFLPPLLPPANTDNTC